MRHINSMTRNELNKKIESIDNEMVKTVSKDIIRWNELYYLKEVLTAEASKRAKDIGTAHTALSYGMVL